MEIRSTAYYSGLCNALKNYGIDPKLVESPWGSTGLMFHFTYQRSVTVLLGLYTDPQSGRPFIVLECGLGHVPANNMYSVMSYCSTQAYSFAFPARFCLKDEGDDGMSLLVLNFRACAYLINSDYIGEILDSMLGVSVIEARNTMELGLRPWASQNVA